jgi:hypothetical protein
MLRVKDLKIFSLDLDYLDMTWEIETTTEDVWDYRFTMERSESVSGPWDQISDEFTDKYLFRDVMLNQQNRHRFFYYRIKIRRVSDSETKYSDVAAREPPADLVAQEVRRVEYVLFKEHIGRKCWVFPRRTFGQRCPDCYDTVTGHQVRDQCVTCFDTTFVRGFLDPIETWVQFDPTPLHTENLSIAKTQQENKTARVLDFPRLKPQDIIVEAENKRWSVERVTPTERLRAPLHQELVLHGIPLSNIEWKLPVRLDDLGTFQAGPSRDFTNPHSLEAAKEADYLAAALAVYGYRG